MGEVLSDSACVNPWGWGSMEALQVCVAVNGGVLGARGLLALERLHSRVYNEAVLGRSPCPTLLRVQGSQRVLLRR